MNERILQLKRALRIVLIVQLLSILGTMNSFAQERGLPTVTTSAVTKSGNDVVSGGNVVNDGGSPVTARGICYGNNPNPDLGASFTHTENGTGTGSYTSVISASATGTIYVRAYATNANGTAYGDELSVNVDYYRLPRFEYNEHTYVVAPDPTSYNGYISWGSANSYCENLTAYGYSDWRMPTIEELEMMYLYRESIGGFVNGYYPMNYYSIYELYHSASMDLAGIYHLQIKWWNGSRVSRQEYNDYGNYYDNTNKFYYYCHVRPIRVETIVPLVTTNDITNITPTSVICGGNVTDEGNGAVTARGVCWSASPNPTTNNSHTNDGAGKGNYTSVITGLTPGTLYYVRAYASNSEGTSYGNQLNFTTTRVTVTTNNVMGVTQTSATCGGYVTIYNGTTVTERGVCWSTSNQSPTLSDSHTSSGSGSGVFTSNLTGLTQNTTYYVRAYATSSEGTAYGETKQFKTTKFEYRISEGGVVATSAGGYFYDSGGPDNNYGNNEQYTMTFISNQGVGTKIQMTFTEFYTAGYWGDYLVIYDGMNTSAPMIGTYGYGYGNSPGTITATNSDGALTFVWISDDWYTNTGWKAAISIVGQSYSYTINTTANPSYGGTVSGGGYYNSGESCTVTAQANDGYVFTNWTENGNVVSTNASYTFTVNSNRSLVANFQAQPQSFTINVSANPTNGGTAAGGGTYNQGASCTVTATANAGYTFTNWTENGNVVSTQANYTFQVNNNRSLVANFVEVGGDNCNIVFDLMDSYGDGWNGNKLNVAFSDGSPSQELTFTTGYNASYMIGVNDGVYVTLSWTQGSYISECSFRVRYEIGPQIYYGSNLNSSFSYIFQMDCSSSNNNIAFADANVKALCVANWDTSGDGELSYAEAAAVTNLGQVFQNNTGITYFNELQYFVGLTSIGSNAFYGCSALASVSIPNSVTYFGGNAFTNCSSLTSITLPNSLTSIGNNAFFGCTGLTSIIIPSSVTSLGTEVFRDCPGLAQMSVRSGNPVYDSRSYCNAIIKTATNELVYGCKNTVIPNSVTSIGGAFDGCTSLISIEIPSSVTSIGSYAFYNCTSLTTMTVLAETPPTLGSSVFHNVNKSIPVYVPCGSIEAYQSATSWSEFTNYLGIGCQNLQVQANYYPDVNDPRSPYVNVYWGTTTSLGEAFESGDFSNIDWMLDPIYPWSITTINPYDGIYCMKSGGTGVNNAVSTMTVTVNIPNDGVMSFFSKISCESNWDWGYFYIDGVQKGAFTGSSSWTEKIYYITAGEHTFQWRYTKDGSVNSNDDCFYVDYITFYKQPDPVQAGWHTYAEGDFSNAVGSNVGTSRWAYEYPVSLCAQYAGFTMTKVSLFSDNMYSAVGGNYTCTIYAGGSEPMAGTALSTITVDVPANQNDWVDFDLTTPVSVTGTEALWVVWTANTTVSSWPAGCWDGLVEQGTWWSAGLEAGYGWEHSTYGTWTMKNYFTDNRGNSVELGFTDNVPIDVEKPQGNNRTYEYFRVYRAQCNGSGTTLIADNLAQHYYFDIEWLDLDPGIYKYGVYSLNGNTTDIVWSNCIEKLASYQIAATANPTEGGIVTGDGTYIQGASCILTAAANNGYSFTNWTENGTVVSTNASYSFTVNGNRNLVANFNSEENHWNVNIYEYPYNMSVTGIIQIDGVEQQTETLEIGAFCGSECRGTQRLTYFPQVNRYLVFLTLYGDAGDVMSFRLYDHALGQELDLSCLSTITFVPDGFMGNAFDPYVFSFGNTMVEQVSNFSQGYNWWGTYIEQEGIDGLGMLQNGLGDNGVTIRSQASGYTDYYQGYGWYGSLSSINNESSYRVITSAPCTVTMTGNAAVPSQHPITLSQGWTWIGYVPSTTMSVDAALANLDAVQGDKLKSQQGYADYYVGYGWYGSLNTIEPGMGLMYYSTNGNPISFTYPDNGRGGELRQNLTAENNHWVPNVYAYPDNMTVMAVVEFDNVELSSDNYELAAFTANGECRGSVRLTYAEPINRHVAFLTISGKDAAELSFRLYDTETGVEYYDAEESLDFVADAIVGESNDLYVIHFRGNTGMDEFASRVKVYPNPVAPGERFSIGMNMDIKSPIRVEIVNALGAVVSVETSAQAPASIVAPITAGVYTLRITVEGKGTAVRKLVVK